jgi:Leucine-rich repeat (LRR) protein
MFMRLPCVLFNVVENIRYFRIIAFLYNNDEKQISMFCQSSQRSGMFAYMKLLCSIVRTSLACARLWCLVPLVWVVVAVAVLPARAQTTTYTVPEAAEANKLYTSANGAGWKNKQGWPLQMTYTTMASIGPLVEGVIFSGLESELLIRQLSLFDNRLSGSIPNFNLPNLEWLELSNNQLSGTIPNFNLPNLEWLLLFSNQLSGSIPNFNLPNLQAVWLYSNQLSGSIPNFNLPNLLGLSLFDNRLSGSIPNFNLPNLRGLYLYENQLSSSIPNFNLPNLQRLYLYLNQLSGSIPNFNLPNLQWLDLSANQLSGSIPNFNLPNLQRLYLNYNQLSGSIPDFNLLNLQNLELVSNRLSGSIPNFNLPNLKQLYLSYNQLSGSIPNFNLPNLQWLRLYNNQLSGSIPNFNLPNLQLLHLSANQLSGSIPNFNLPSLQLLELQNNQLSGCDADWTKVPILSYLHLERNKLVFRDLEPAAKAMQGRAGAVFSYSPQDSVVTLKSGDTVRVDVGGEQTRYQWLRNGEAIINATQASYTTTDTALYSCRSTNTLLPNLTLYSRPVRGGTVITSVTEINYSQDNQQTKEIITALNIRPNPFWEYGSISYSLTSRASVSIVVYSLLGQKLLTVFEGEQSAGTHVQELAMSAFSIGVYLVRMQAGDGVQSAFVHYVR